MKKSKILRMNVMWKSLILGLIVLHSQLIFGQPTVCNPAPADITTNVIGEPELLNSLIPNDKVGIYPNGKPVPTIKEMFGTNLKVGEENEFPSTINLTDIFSSARHFLHMNKDYYNDGVGLPANGVNLRKFPPYADRGRLNLIVDSAGKPVNRTWQSGDKKVRFDPATNTLITETVTTFFDPYQNYMNINYLHLKPIYDKFQTKVQVALTVVPDNFPVPDQPTYAFPNTWWTESDWGTSEANIRTAAKAYAMMFARTYSPKAADCSTCVPLVGVLEVGNEPWGYSSTTYRAIVDGFIMGINEYYTSDPANKIKLIPAAFQSNHLENTSTPDPGAYLTWKDYQGTRINPNHKCYLNGVNFHPYGVDLADIAGPTSSGGNGGCYGERLIAFPEKVTSGVTKSKFLFMKNAWRWTKDNMTLSTNSATDQNIFVSEYGYDSYNQQSGCPKPWWCTDPNVVNNATGLGEEAQGIYIVRSTLMLARLGVFRAHLYETIDDPYVGTCQYAYHSSGLWKRNGSVIVPKISKKTVHKFIHLLGTTKFRQRISEVSGGLYAYVLENSSGTPAFLVAWKAVDAKDKSWVDIKNDVTSNVTINLNFGGSNYAVNTGQPWYYLDDDITTDANGIVTNVGTATQSTFFNSATSTFSIRPVPFLIPIVQVTQPDYIVQAAGNPSPTGVAAGSAVTLSGVQIKNNGTSTSTSSNVKFYRSVDALYDAGDVQIGAAAGVAVAGLASGATNNLANQSLTIPAGTAVGLYYIIVRADANNTLTESNESNNTAATIQIRVGPDYTVTIAGTPSPTSLNAGASLTLTGAQVKNLGSATGTSSVVKFYLSANQTYEAGDVQIGAAGGVSVAGLAFNALNNLAAQNLTIPVGTASGTYYIIVRADANSQITEAVETNNTIATIPITIGCSFTETFVRSALVSNCRTYTLTISSTVNATNAVYTLAGLPGNGYDVPGSSWTAGTNFVFTAPTFVTTASWTIPTVTAGTNYTLVLKYCFSSPFTCPTFTMTTNGCNKNNISANCAAMILPNPDPNDLVGSNEVLGENGSLQVFPNPTSTGILNFKANVVSAKKAEVVILNNIGQEVLVKEIDKIDVINELDIKSLPVGPYTLTVKCEGCPKLAARFMVIKDN